jgi:hypothetical protein
MTNSMPSISDCSYWIYETERFLFLAKIYLEERKEKPEINGDPINYIEAIINLGTINEDNTASPQRSLLLISEEEPLPIAINENIKFELSEIDTPELIGTLRMIKEDRWDELSLGKIEISESILYNILKEIKRYEQVE